MAQFETTGGGLIDSGDRRIDRKVIVSTDGETPTQPEGTGRLTNVSITSEAGGIRRGVFEFTTSGQGGDFSIYQPKVELMGGSRELPIYNHPNFAALTKEQVLSVQKAVQEKQNRSFTNSNQQKLFEFLSRGTEYFLAPSVIARITEIESETPKTTGLCNVADLIGVEAPNNTFWVMTGMSSTPVGDVYQVTREYTSIPAAWEDVGFLYTNW